MRDAEDDASDEERELENLWDEWTGDRQLRGERKGDVAAPAGSDTGGAQPGWLGLMRRVQVLERNLERGYDGEGIGKGKGREVDSAVTLLSPRPNPPRPSPPPKSSDLDMDRSGEMDIDPSPIVPPHQDKQPQPTAAHPNSPGRRAKKLITLRDKLDDYLSRVRGLEEAIKGYEERFEEMENWAHLRDGEDMALDSRKVARTWEELEERRDPRGKLRGLRRAEGGEGVLGGEGWALSGQGGVEKAVKDVEAGVAGVDEGGPVNDTTVSTTVAASSPLPNGGEAISKSAQDGHIELIRSLEAQVKILTGTVRALQADRHKVETGDQVHLSQKLREEEMQRIMALIKKETETQTKKVGLSVLRY